MATAVHIDISSWALAAAGVLFGVFVWRTLSSRAQRRRGPLPPGPPGWPIIGNVLDVPSRDEHVKYAELSKKYGDVVYLDAGGQPMVILGSQRAAVELLDRRGAVYSSRPKSHMLELCGTSMYIGLMPYGEKWRVRRKAFHAANLAEHLVDYYPYQLAAVHTFLQGMLESPQDVFKLCRYMVGSVIIRTTYGIKTRKRDDQYIEAAEQVMSYLAQVMVPGKFWLDFFPLLRFAPSWMPGAGFQDFAAEVKATNGPAIVRSWNDRSLTEASMASRMLEESYKADDKEKVAIDAAATSYIAGVDTTNAALGHFIAAMLLCPDVQAKAQAELDAIVGSDRLPDFSDRSNLPYVNSVILETLRWKVLLPMGLPHCTTADDVFDGYFIPRGSLLMANLWAIMHDPEVYEDPDDFRPERFLRTGAQGQLELNPEVLDPAATIFGYGRRKCPGMNLSRDTLFAAISSMLATLEITPASGLDAPRSSAFQYHTSGLLCAVLPFDCSIKPRSARAVALIAQVAKDAERNT